MSTSVTALLNETEDLREEGSEMPEEEDQYPEDSLHGKCISLLVLLADYVKSANFNQTMHGA